MTCSFAAAQPSHGGSEDTHDPHYAARRCSASPWPACAPAAASRSAGRPRLGRGVRFDLAPGALLSLGDGCRVGDGCRFHLGAGAAVVIGAGARLGERCVVAAHERIEIGPGARLGDEVVLIDFDHDVGDVERPVREQPLVTAPVVIGARAVVGAAAGVLRGVTVGEGARVGVRAVVTHDVPPGARAEGTPARVQPPRALTPAAQAAQGGTNEPSPSTTACPPAAMQQTASKGSEPSLRMLKRRSGATTRQSPALSSSALALELNPRAPAQGDEGLVARERVLGAGRAGLQQHAPGAHGVAPAAGRGQAGDLDAVLSEARRILLSDDGHAVQAPLGNNRQLELTIYHG